MTQVPPLAELCSRKRSRRSCKAWKRAKYRTPSQFQVMDNGNAIWQCRRSTPTYNRSTVTTTDLTDPPLHHRRHATIYDGKRALFTFALHGGVDEYELQQPLAMANGMGRRHPAQCDKPLIALSLSHTATRLIVCTVLYVFVFSFHFFNFSFLIFHI